MKQNIFSVTFFQQISGKNSESYEKLIKKNGRSE